MILQNDMGPQKCLLFILRLIGETIEQCFEVFMTYYFWSQFAFFLNIIVLFHIYKQWLDIIVVSFCGVVKIVVKHMLVKKPWYLSFPVGPSRRQQCFLKTHPISEPDDCDRVSRYRTISGRCNNFNVSNWQGNLELPDTWFLPLYHLM